MVTVPIGMDPHYWHLKSLFIDHYHPYCRPSYLDPISTLCIEPSFKSSDSKFGQTWIDIEGDEIETSHQAALTLTDNSSPFACFCSSDPTDESKCENTQVSYTYELSLRVT